MILVSLSFISLSYAATIRPSSSTLPQQRPSAAETHLRPNSLLHCRHRPPFRPTSASHARPASTKTRSARRQRERGPRSRLRSNYCRAKRRRKLTLSFLPFLHPPPSLRRRRSGISPSLLLLRRFQQSSFTILHPSFVQKPWPPRLLLHPSKHLPPLPPPHLQDPMDIYFD